jgi:hypothetical protein
MNNSAGEGDTSVTSFPSPEPPNRSPAVALEPVVVHGLSSRRSVQIAWIWPRLVRQFVRQCA